MIKSPCIGICSTASFGDAVCIGCKRTFEEWLGWNAMNDEEKQAVLDRIKLDKSLKT